MKYLKQDDIKDDYYRYVVITRMMVDGLPNNRSAVTTTHETEGKAHVEAQRRSDQGFWVDTYYVIGRNERTGTEL